MNILLVKGLTAEVHDTGVPFLRRPAFYALLSLVVLVILNIIYW